MIWLKRLSPLIVVGLCWLIWSLYQHHRDQVEREAIAQKAHVMAQIWVASAKFRDDLPRYRAVRDSMLTAARMTREEFTRYLSAFESDPSRGLEFSQALSASVDSLYAREDSLWKAAHRPSTVLPGDSAAQAAAQAKPRQ